MSRVGYNDGRGGHAGRAKHAGDSGAADGAAPVVPPPGSVDRHARGRGDGRGDGKADAPLENAHAALHAHAMASDQRTDEQLLNAYQQGDKASFATLVSRYLDLTMPIVAPV